MLTVGLPIKGDTTLELVLHDDFALLLREFLPPLGVREV
jgi:hypothetical protein